MIDKIKFTNTKEVATFIHNIVKMSVNEEKCIKLIEDLLKQAIEHGKNKKQGE